MARKRVKVRLEVPGPEHEHEFLESVKRSGALHRPWVSPPASPKAYRAWIENQDGRTNVAFLAISTEGEIVGVVNVSQMVRGLFCSAYLGYYGFAPHTGKGYMTAALAAVVSTGFRKLGMHRLEANIQPGNRESIALVRRLGFRKEGFSPRYLKIGGRWRDHERWALTREDWNGTAG